MGRRLQVGLWELLRADEVLRLAGPLQAPVPFWGEDETGGGSPVPPPQKTQGEGRRLPSRTCLRGHLHLAPPAPRTGSSRFLLSRPPVPGTGATAGVTKMPPAPISAGESDVRPRRASPRSPRPGLQQTELDRERGGAGEEPRDPRPQAARLGAHAGRGLSAPTLGMWMLLRFGAGGGSL